MPKTMAVIKNGVVDNTIWCADSTSETDEIKDVYEKKVEIGDLYEDGKYYRDGVEVLSPTEEMILHIEDLTNALSVFGVK